jgi:hypothetical protein
MSAVCGSMTGAGSGANEGTGGQHTGPDTGNSNDPGQERSPDSKDSPRSSSDKDAIDYDQIHPILTALHQYNLSNNAKIQQLITALIERTAYTGTIISAEEPVEDPSRGMGGIAEAVAQEIGNQLEKPLVDQPQTILANYASPIIKYLGKDSLYSAERKKRVVAELARLLERYAEQDYDPPVDGAVQMADLFFEPVLDEPVHQENTDDDSVDSDA